ncbi:MAG: 2-C-methyl-D-erythritol 2,4-cyclodiphosphate synthase [Holosporales bacterium]|jgi:2-C-methyl-D-erythritol 4-phosphate cytidylyltransferase/2-C-methyl-D-erythritol 2,4-cyclodiphosphate synthase|nr:2-C-methyl-D-erythritol 2,4-cyclodiphosphate synthase [Holosporales bacterium]
MSLINKSRNLKPGRDNHRIFVVIAASGVGSRFVSALPKQFCLVRGVQPVRRSVDLFLSCDYIDGVVVVIPDGFQEIYKKSVAGINDSRLLASVVGGTTRKESVFTGLRAIREHSPDSVLIHDAVRCFCDPEIVGNVVGPLLAGEIAVIPAMVPVDSVRILGQQVDRNKISLIQTPQGFHFDTIYNLHEKYKDVEVGDDAALCDLGGIVVKIVSGSPTNKKITYRSDIDMRIIKIGLGYDAHRFSNDPNRELFLMGKKIDGYIGLDGVSDADVGIHSLVDAILGALCCGSIGERFDPTDSKWIGTDSKFFLDHCRRLLLDKKASIVNTDTTIVCEKPNIAAYSSEMKEIVAMCLGIDSSVINIKGKTTERMGFEGRCEGISAYSIATVSVELI